MKSVFSLLILFLAAHAFAATTTDWQAFMANTSAPAFALNEQQDDASASTSMAVQTNPELKSLKKSMFYSLVVPGAGQAYNGSWWKAAGFAAIEVAGWAVFAIKHSEGKDIEDEFHDYANTHWSEPHYWDWISHHSGVNRDDMDALRDWEHDHFSHGLHVNKDQQYYEMIGKYYQFNYGWDDFREDHGIEMTHETMTINKIYSSNRRYYEDRRDASNQALKMATTGATVVLFNHIFSAFEAAFSTKLHNDKIQTALRFEPRYLNSEPVTVLSLQMNW